MLLCVACLLARFKGSSNFWHNYTRVLHQGSGTPHRDALKCRSHMCVCSTGCRSHGHLGRRSMPLWMLQRMQHCNHTHRNRSLWVGRRWTFSHWLRASLQQR